MTTRMLHVAAAQIHSGGGPADVLRRVDRQARAAAAVGAQVILFSECALHGYDYDLTRASVRRIAEPADGSNGRKIVRLAKRHGLAIAIGFFERSGNDIHNSLLVVRPDGTIEVARKHNLTGSELKAELTPGPRSPTVVRFNSVRVAMIICADGGVRGLHQHLAREKVDYRFCATAGGGRMSEMIHERALLTTAGRRRYAKNRPRVFKAEAVLDRKECPTTGFTSANALGPVGRRTCHQGHCMIVDNRRIMRAQIPGTVVLEHQQDQMIHAELAFF